MSSPRSREHYQAQFQPAFYNRTVLATDTGTITAFAARSGLTLYVQSIMFACTTGAAQTLTFQDSAGTPIVVAKTPASCVQGTAYLYDLGPSGFPITDEKGLNLVISGAGPAGTVHIEAYYRLMGSGV
jgi:hypothetical protein